MPDITKSVKFLLLGDDRTASKSLKSVGGQAEKTHGKLDKLKTGAKVAGAALVAGLAVAGVAAIDFGKDSLAAFADADKSQKLLEDAYRRFPKIADVNIESLRKYNEALQRKTGADADDIAAAQSHLAAFNLTGKQIKATTPLLVDYATKTGKDMPTAAKTLGKALLGNTKALKDMGISYKSTGDPAKDYAAIMDLVRAKVGGYAASIPEAEKKQKILQASFGDLQEEVGQRLQPVMMGLIDAGQGVLDWLEANPEVVEGAAAAFGLLGDVLMGLWDIIRTYVAPALARFIRMNADVVDSVAGMLESLGQVPGFEWATEAAGKIRGVTKGMRTVADGLDALARAKTPEPKVDVKTEQAKTKISEIDRKIKSLKGRVVKAEAKGDTKQVDRLKQKIRELKGKRVELEAHVKKTGVTSIALKRGSARGLQVVAAATGGWRSGLVEVGEYGREVLYLSRPTFIGTHAQADRAMAAPATSAAAGGARSLTAYVDVRVAPGADRLAIGREIRDVLLELQATLGGRGLGLT